MNKYTSNQIDLILGQLNGQIEFEQVILFGSHAYGEPNEDSDIDLCFIFSDRNIRKREVLKAIRKLIAPVLLCPVDILLFEKEEFNQRSRFKTTLEHQIYKDGVKVYG